MTENRRVYKFEVIVDAEWCKWTDPDKVHKHLGSMLYDACLRQKASFGSLVQTVRIETIKEESTNDMA
jgi:hypothetical protein